MLAKDITKAGETIFVRITGAREKAPSDRKRKRKTNATPETVKKLNEKNSKRNLQMIINHNFGPGDIHLVLTYGGKEPEKEAAKKNLEKFKRRLTSLYRKNNILLKYISVTEFAHKRIHHHMVITGGIDIWELAKLWPHGHIRPAYLDDTGDYRKLANYLIKETSKYFRTEEAISKRRFNCSRSIVRPETKRDPDVKASELLEPKAPPGFYIDPDSLFQGFNPLTEKPYTEYVLLPVVDNPWYKRWSKLRPAPRQRLGFKGYLEKNTEVQIPMDITEVD